MNMTTSYTSPSFNVRIGWLDNDEPLMASCTCETSRLLPYAVLRFDVDVPDNFGWSDVYWIFFVIIAPEAMSFDVWQQIEDQPWSHEFSWGPEDLHWEASEASCPTDDLSNSLYEADARGVFDAYARLRGGMVEFAGWQVPVSGEEPEEHDTSDYAYALSNDKVMCPDGIVRPYIELEGGVVEVTSPSGKPVKGRIIGHEFKVLHQHHAAHRMWYPTIPEK